MAVANNMIEALLNRPVKEGKGLRIDITLPSEEKGDLWVDVTIRHGPLTGKDAEQINFYANNTENSENPPDGRVPKDRPMAPELVRADNEKTLKYSVLLNHAVTLHVLRGREKKTTFVVAGLNHTGEVSKGLSTVIERLAMEKANTIRNSAQLDTIGPKKASARFRSGLLTTLMCTLWNGWGAQLDHTGFPRAGDIDCDDY
jgi:hypothetical protein